MKFIKTILSVVALSTMVASCDMGDFGDINVDPNTPSEPQTSSLFLFSARYTRNFVMTSSVYDPWPMLWTGYLAETKNNQFGALTTTTNFGTGNYYLYAIKNLNEVIALNENDATKSKTTVLSFGSNANQIAAAKTLRAYFYMKLTDILGPIAYTDAFKGESDGKWTPAYDSQETVYAGLDKDLRDAYALFDTSTSLSEYDIFYKGNISKWKKLNASLRMMMAIKMADVDPTNGKARFAQAYADGGMTEVADGFHYTFDSNSEAYSTLYYIGNSSYTSATLAFAPNKIFVEALKEYKDPRLFVYCSLDGYLGTRPGSPTDFDAYQGIPFGLSSHSAVVAAANQACSVAAAYCEAQATYGLITTARTLLVEAEAAKLGWINANAEDLYKAGIRASFAFCNATDVDAYLASAKVQLSTDQDTALRQIVMQRYLAGFMTDGIEAWSDWRRYNVPTMTIEAGQTAKGITVYPYRMQYSDTDKQYNVANTSAAISAYLNGKDDRWQRVWWDTKDNL